MSFLFGCTDVLSGFAELKATCASSNCFRLFSLVCRGLREYMASKTKQPSWILALYLCSTATQHSYYISGTNERQKEWPFCLSAVQLSHFEKCRDDKRPLSTLIICSFVIMDKDSASHRVLASMINGLSSWLYSNLAPGFNHAFDQLWLIMPYFRWEDRRGCYA